jgi:CHAT domain-containing protein/tetratricopeptide (TPR) repeat protein
VRATRTTVAVLLFAGCGWAGSEESAAREGRTAILHDRFIEGRLAAQTTWQPCTSSDSTRLIARARCAGLPPQSSAAFARLAAATADAGRLGRDSSPAALQVSAHIELRWRDATPAGVDRAVASLERASQRAPADVAMLNDLAIAYLALAERDQQLRPALRALDAVERALVQDSMSAPARFNRALILERLHLVQSARRAWMAYPSVDPASPWHDEAVAHERSLARRLGELARLELGDERDAREGSPPAAPLVERVRRSPQATRDRCIALLAEWGMAATRGDQPSADHALARVRELARLLDLAGADRSVALALAAIERAAGDRHRTALLATGHADLATGIAAHGRAAFDDAAAALIRAERALRTGGSPMAGWATSYLGAAEIFRGDYRAADDALSRALREATPVEPALAGKATWALGVSRLRRGAYEDANRLYEQARPHFIAAREPENLAAISFLRAEGLTLAGQPAAADDEALRALRGLSSFRRSLYLSNHLTAVAALARADGLHHAALAVLGEVLEVEQTGERPYLLAFAHIARGADLVALHRSAEARAELDEAMRSADHISPGSGRDRVRADAQLVIAELTRRADPRGAMQMLSFVVDVYRRLKTDGHLAAALYQRARAAVADGDSVVARRDLVEAIAAIERQNRSVRTTEVRATLYETVERVFDAMTELELGQGRPDSAFGYLERGRIAGWGSVTPNGAGGAPPTIPGLDGIAARLPAGTLFVEYAVLADRIVAWTATRHSRSVTAVPIARDSLARLVERANDETGAALFDLIVRPMLPATDDIQELAIVPDRELSRLSFAALRDRGANAYLLERYGVRVLPSAVFLLARPQPSVGGGTALVVGDPAVSPGAAADLGPLRGAAREAAAVAALYPHSVLLTGAAARRDRVLALLPRSTVFHFAGHAVVDGSRPERSYLALAADDASQDGTLHAREIGGLRLSIVRLVILSACRTSSPRPSRMGGIAGLAYSFLRAGAPATIGTLWDVGDDQVSEVLIDFHRRLVAGTAPAIALRLAQLAALHSDRRELRDPRVWGAYVYTGP